jgi:hypothetical protein
MVNILQKEELHERDKVARLKAAHAVIDIAKHFSRVSAVRPIRHEDTFIHDILDPWVKNIFYGEYLDDNW